MISFEQGFEFHPRHPWYRLKGTNITVNADDFTCDCRQDTFRLEGRIQKPCIHVFALRDWLSVHKE